MRERGIRIEKERGIEDTERKKDVQMREGKKEKGAKERERKKERG